MHTQEPAQLKFLQATLVVALAFSLTASSVLAQDAVAPSPAAPPTGATSNAPAPQPARDPNGNLLPTSGGEASTERVFVTGSIIPGAAEVGPNPVLNVNRDLINKTGERSTEELLRNLAGGEREWRADFQ